MKILIDQEVDLEESDLLQTKSYADSLQKLILSAPKDQPLTIGLFGKWGSGKSSIIKTIANKLQAKGSLESSEIKFILYDAWKYTNDSFRRTFITSIQKSLGIEPTEAMKNFYASQSRETGVRRVFNIPFLFLTTVSLLMGFYVYQQIDAGQQPPILPIIISLLSLVGTIISKIFYEYKTTTQKPVLFAPEQFEECFKEILSIALGRQKNEGFLRWFKKPPKTYNRIVIVIDNIDRCPRDAAYDLLVNTKHFLDSKLNVMFLIPVDEQALIQHIFKDKSSREKEGEEFLRKYFNVTLRLKKFKTTELFDFALAINEKYQIGLSPDTINIIAKEYATNPRRILQFFNNLSLELETLTIKYGETFTREYQVAICKFLIIREEWPEQYLKLCIEPESLILSNDQEAIAGSNDHPESYEAFMDSTYVSTRYLTANVIQQILINSDNYTKIPEKIDVALDKTDPTSFKKALNDHDFSYERLTNHLLFGLKKSLEKRLYDTDVSLFSHRIWSMIIMNPINPEDIADRLSDITRKRMNQIIDSTKDFNLFVKASNQLVSKNKLFIDNAITAYCLDFVYQEGKFYDGVQFELYQAYILNASEEQIQKAKTSFWNYLNSNKLNNKLRDQFSSGVLQELYDTETIRKYLINPEVLPWADENYPAWEILAKRLNNSNPLLEALLSHVRQVLKGRDLEFSNYKKTFTKLFSQVKFIRPSNEMPEHIDQINREIFRLQMIKRNPERKMFAGIHEDEILTLAEYLVQCFRISSGSPQSGILIESFIDLFGWEPIEQPLVKMLKQSKEFLNYPSLINVLYRIEHLKPASKYLIETLLLSRSKNNIPISKDEVKAILQFYLDKSVNDASFMEIIDKIKNDKRALQIFNF